MSVTYIPEPDTNAVDVESDYVPVYARTGRAKSVKGGKQIKTWMILAPVGAVVLIGGAVAMMTLGGGEDAAPLAEAPTTAPVLAPLTAEPAPALVDGGLGAAPMTSASTPAPVDVVPAAPAPVVREAAPVRRAAPAPVAQRRAGAEPGETPRAAAPEVVAPSGPQPYSASPAAPTSTLNAPSTSAPATAPATPPAPAIVVQPLG